MKNIYNESKKGDIIFAQQVKKTYKAFYENLQIKISQGDKPACLILIEKLTEENVVLYHLGFKLNDSGRLIKLK